MTERIKPEQMPTALKESRKFELAWRVLAHPTKYTGEDRKAANEFLLQHKDNYEMVITCPPDPETWDPEIYDKIFAGLFHYNIRYPQNVQGRTFKEN